VIFPHNTRRFQLPIPFKYLQNNFLFAAAFLICSNGFAQSKIDSLTTFLQNEDSPSKKAELHLERAILFDKTEIEKAFLDVDAAYKYYTEKRNQEGQTDSYIAYGNLYFLNGEPMRAAHYDSLAIQLAEKISYKKGTAMATGNLAREFINTGNFNKAENLIKSAIDWEENFKPQDKERLAELYNRYAILSASQGDQMKSLSLTEKAMKYSENSNDDELLSRIYNNYANTLSRLSRYDESVKIHFKVIRLSEKNKDALGLIRAYNNLGIDFRNSEEFDKAITYFKKSLTLAKKHKVYKSMGLSTINLATVYSAKEQYQAMDTLYMQGIQYFEKASDLGGIAFANHNYGNFLLIQENYSEADKHLLKALELRKQIGARRHVGTTLSVLGKSALEQKRLNDSEKYLLEAEEILNESEQEDRSLKELYHYLKQLYSEKGDYKRAFHYQTKELVLEHTLFTENEKIIALKTEAAYEMEKRDMEAAIEQEKQRRDQQRLLVVGSGIFLILCLVFLVLWLRRKQLKERHQAQLLNLDQQHRLNLTKSLKDAEQQERKKIAHKLHDEAGSMLSIAILNVKQLQNDIFKAGGSAGQKLETTQKLLVDISHSVRNISHTLMPVALEKQGLKVAIHDLVNAVNTSQKIKIEEIVEGLENTHLWSEEFCITVYRIVQEVMNNIIKHSQATNVLLQIVELEESVTIYIEDNGKGLNENVDVEGIGLKMLKNNVEYFNGTIEISGRQNNGTFILAELPIEKLNSNTASIN
jgi:signal transduction histidine kinase